MIDLQQSGAGLAGYALLAAQAEALFAGERDFIANAAQFSAFLFHELGDLNWAGFYLNRNEELVLGPFQGKVACVRIPFSKGVCGAAARTRLTQRVDDVHAFPGHIACDSASSSELVVPLLKDGRLVAVLDLDSPSVGRFSAEDRGPGRDRRPGGDIPAPDGLLSDAFRLSLRACRGSVVPPAAALASPGVRASARNARRGPASVARPGFRRRDAG